MRNVFVRASLIAVLTCCLTLYGQELSETSRSSNAPNFQFRKIELPEGELSRIPLKDWIPISPDEFESLLKRIQSSVDPADSCSITRAHYSAEFREGMLRDGRFALSVQKFGSGSRPLILSPCSLPVREIAWRDRPASGGTNTSGQQVITVDREAGELVGKWDLASRSVEEGTEFELEIPQAAISTLELNLPEEFGLTVGDPTISVTKATPEEGKRNWSLILGSRTKCRLIIRKQETSKDIAPTLVCRQESSYSLRRDGIRLREQIQMHPVGGGIQNLSFQVDSGLQVLSVSLGADIPLQWNEQANDQQKQIVTVRFPDPVFESERPLVLQFVAPSRINQSWRLPRVSLTDAIVEEHQLALTVETPLELKSLQPVECHQTGIDPVDSPLRTFLADGSEPALEVVVGTPSLRTGCLVSGEVRCDREYWTGEFELEFNATAGSDFSVPLRILPDWEIIEVRAGGSTTASNQELVHWDVIDQSDKSQILNIDLQDALRVGFARIVYVKIRRSAPVGEETISVPVIEPAFPVSPLDLLIRILHDNLSTAVLEPGSSFEVVSTDELPEPWRERPFFLDRPVEDREAFVLRLNDAVPNGEMFVRSTQLNLTGSADVTADFSNDRIQEQITLKITPQGRIDRILVYLSDSGDELKWTPLNSGTLSIDAVRLPSSRHAVWRAPPDGELWELNLSTPQTEPFEIRGSRTSLREERGKIALPWLPQADIFEGDVRMTAGGTEVPRLEVRGGEQLQFSRPNRREPRVAEWRYIHSSQAELSSSITYAYSQKSSIAVTLPAATSNIVVRPGRNGLSRDLYEIDIEFVSPVPLTQVGMAMPDDAQILESTVDGSHIEIARRGEETQFASPMTSHGRAFRIRYSLPTLNGLVRKLLFPKFHFTISQVEWQLILPDGLALAHWPSEWGLPDQQPPPIWRQIRPAKEEHSAGSEADPASFDFRPGERMITGRTLSIPASVELRLWNRTFFVPLAWLSFLACVGLRLASRQWNLFQAKPVLIPGSIVTLALLIHWLPAGWSFVAFTAMIGLIVGTVVPRWWIPQKLESNSSGNESTSDEGTKLIATSVSSGIAVIAICLSSHVSAQEPASTSSAVNPPSAIAPTPSIPLPTRQVVVPLPENGTSENKPALYYLSPDWKPLIEKYSPQSIPEDAPAYLIRSAQHQLSVTTVDETIYRLKLEIEVIEPTLLKELTIPLSNLRFGGEESCLVDGVPASLFAVPGQSSVRISLPEPSKTEPQEEPSEKAGNRTRHQIELRGFPIISGNDLEWTWKSKIPVSVDSIFIGEFNRSVDDFQVLSARGAPQWDSEHRKLQVALGNTPELSVAFHPKDLLEVLEARTDVSAIGRLEIGSVTSNLDYRIKFSGNLKGLRQIPLLLPPDAIVRGLTLGAEPGMYSSERLENGTLLRLSLPERSFESLEIRLRFQLLRGDSTTEAKLPAISFFSEGTADRFRLADHLLGIHIDPNRSVTPALQANDLIEKISMEEFLTSWGTDPIPPQLAVRLLGPTPLDLEFSPVITFTDVTDDRVQVAIHLHRVDFEWGITVKNQQRHPRFEYLIEVPTTVQIDSVTVTENGAGRLLQWTRQGKLLRLFLREPSTGIQRIVVKATAPMRAPAEIRLPTFNLVEEIPIDRRVEVSVNPQLVAVWIDEAGLKPTPDFESAELNSAGDVRIGAWMIPAENRPDYTLQVERNDPQITGDLATIVEKKSDVWRLQTHILFRVTRGYATEFRLRFPASLPAPQIFAPGAIQGMEPLSGQSGTLVTLIPSVAVNDQFHVVVTAEIPPPRNIRWIVPRIMTPGVELERSFVVVDPPDLIDESDPAESGLRGGTLAPELTSLIEAPIVSRGKVFESYRGDDTWVLALRTPAVRSNAGRSLFAEDRVRLSEENQVEGRLTLTVSPPPGRRVEFSLPELLSLRRVVLNGQLIDPIKKGNEFTIRITGNADPNRIEIDWVQEKIARSPLPVRTTVRLPRILYPAVDERFALLQLPDDRYDLGTVEGISAGWWNFVLSRTEWLASLSAPVRYRGEYGETLLEQLQGAERLWRSEKNGPLSLEDREEFDQLAQRLAGRNPAPVTAESSPLLSYYLPDPDTVRVFRISGEDQVIAVRLISTQLVWGILTIAGILLARFLLPKIASPWLNEFADRSPVLGWVCCGLLWAFLCTPAWGGLLFAFPAAFAWWSQLQSLPPEEQDFLLPVQESVSSEPGT